MATYKIHANDRVRRRDSQAGVTLIEMIVVLIIISVVAALIVPNVIGRPDEARATVAETDMRSIASALQLYRLDNGRYPTTAQGLSALTQRPSSPPIPRNWPADGYVPDLPRDPWGNPYSYTATRTGFELFSLGADGVPGGEGPTRDISLRVGVSESSL